MCAKRYVFLLGIILNFQMFQTQRPPKVPQIFPPTQPTFITTQQPNEMPLSLQALYAGCPKSSGDSESCKNKLLSIVNFLLERETGDRRKGDPSKILKAKELLQTDNRKLILDATKSTIEYILASNYQHQAISSNVLKQSLGQDLSNIPLRPGVLLQEPMRQYINSIKPNYIHPTVRRTQLIQTVPNFKSLFPVGYNADQRLMQSPNVNPVIPVTSVSGQVNDNENVLVFYKPQMVTYSRIDGNIVRKFSKRILVPYFVSKLT